jgi:hypothetical protein
MRDRRGAVFMVEVFTAETPFAIELVPIPNRSHQFRGFVYQSTRFVRDRNIMGIVRLAPPRLGGRLLGCHQPTPGYDHLPERRFEFIPFWGILVFLLYCIRRVNPQAAASYRKRFRGETADTS